MSRTLSWGVIGTGLIAGVFANGVKQSQTGTLVAVGSRSQAAADTFGETWRIPHRYSRYEDVLADQSVQAVYLALPHPFHAEWAIKAAEAGKHVLCEKPIALNHAEAMAIVEAAQRHDVFLMEAYMYRCHPQTAKLLELIRSGMIGQVRVIQATFSFQADAHPERRLERVNALAKERGVLPLAIALAYVLCQSFPTFPLIGPLALAETRTSWQALDIELTLEEVRWLNLDD